MQCNANLSLLSASALFCFSCVHIVGNLTSKFPSIILYYKIYIKYFLILFCTLKFVQSTFPIRFCTTKFAQNTSQYYFVIYSLHKKYYSYNKFFRREIFIYIIFLNREIFIHIIFYTQHAFTQRNFYTQQIFSHNKYLHTEHLHTIFVLHGKCLYTQHFFKEKHITYNFFQTKKLQNTDKFLHITIFYTQNLLDTIRFFKIKNKETFLYIIRKGIVVPKLELDAKAKKKRFCFFLRDF